MSIPRPPIDLEGHCSAINDETLYVVSPGGFQSLPLKEHAEWSKEDNGVKVTGPACVTVTPNGDESLASMWVIGGTRGGMWRSMKNNTAARGIHVWYTM